MQITRNTTRTLLALLAAAGMASAGSLAYAQEIAPVTAPADTAQLAPISIEQAIAAAQKHHPGSKVKDIEVKGKHGVMVYDIELVSGWKEYDVKVDAATGKVISSRFDGLSIFD